MKYVNYSKVVSHFSKRFYEIAKKIGMSLLVILGMTIESSATIPRETNTSGILDEIDLLEITLPPPTEQYPIPPMPDVWIEGRWVTWEEAYGPIQVYRAASALNQGVSPFQLQTSQSQTSSTSSSLSGYAQMLSSLTLADCDQNKINILKRRAALNLPAPVVPRESMLELQTNSLQNLTNSINLYFLEPVILNAGEYGYGLVAEGVQQGQGIEIFYTQDLGTDQWKGADIVLRTNLTNNSIGLIVCTGGLELLDHCFFSACILQDTDLDGLSDGVEMMIFKSDPNNSDSAILRDQNGDGTPDYANVANNWICDGDEDLDNDGWTNAEELAMGTNPFVKDDNEIDSDNDGLPDWAEDQIRIYCGVQNPMPFEDSDGDGVNNYTELVLGTDFSSSSDCYYAKNYYFGENTTFLMPELFVRSVGTNSTLTNGLFFQSFAILRNYSHISLKKNNVIIDGVYYDSIQIGAAPTYFGSIDLNLPNFDTNAPVNMIRYGLTPTAELLGGSVSVFDGVWHEPGITANLENLDQNSILFIMNRSMGRIPKIMKDLQRLSIPLVTDNFQNQPVGIQQRICKLVSNLLSEASLYERYCTRYSYVNGTFPYMKVIDYGANLCSGVVLALNVYDMNKLYMIEDALEDYFLEIKKSPGSPDMELSSYNLANAIMNYLSGVSSWLSLPISSVNLAFILQGNCL